jgi:protein dithiol:quinone oxidoreductase
MRARARGGASTTPLFAFVAVVSLGVVIVALVSQHAFGMEPCPWCILQRVIFLAIGAFALLGLVWRGPSGGRVAGTFALLLAGGGVAAALWQQLVAARSESCNLTLADRIVGATQLDRLVPYVFEARASCADAAVSLLGLPYAYWSAIAFVVLAIVVLRILRLSV